ncbi:unnamed protein product [Parnassius apollo]|uniref:(apollo) hypothetical protein n=1 Tax=Parnassius apollo TaxID=110799 RepID=A0A8S3X2M9_PARAO|nr:unnamed protein product [Parnassius apollo]
MEVEQNEASDVELNSLSESRPSESLVEPLQIIEEDPVTDSNISLKNINDEIRVLRKDICSTCEKFQVDIQSAEIMKEKDKVASLKSERELHLRKAKVFLKKCSSVKEDKNVNKNKLSICFDFQKNICHCRSLM